MRIHKIHVQIHTGQPGNLQGYSWLPTMLPVFLYTCVSVPKFASLNSLLTAEAIRYVNVDKANIRTGEQIYKINIQLWSISSFGIFLSCLN